MTPSLCAVGDGPLAITHMAEQRAMTIIKIVTSNSVKNLDMTFKIIRSGDLRFLSILNSSIYVMILDADLRNSFSGRVSVSKTAGFHFLSPTGFTKRSVIK